MASDSFFAKSAGMWVVIDAASGYVRSVRFIRDVDNSLKRRITLQVTHDLVRYFQGEPVDFSSYQVELSGFTQFEQDVLTHTRNIGWGTCTTYSRLAGMIGRPGAWRAVGNALGKNPAPVIIPCHRIVASCGIGGYSLGPDLKLKLLKLESSVDYAGCETQGASTTTHFLKVLR